jgi:hypothetical protein
LEKLNSHFQVEAFDHVLQDDERQETAFEAVAEYIARNPERRGLVPTDGFAQYKFTGCLVPGYPDSNHLKTTIGTASGAYTPISQRTISSTRS